jgi:hypothetical protein
MPGALVRRLLCAALLASACGGAQAASFAVRTAGAATVIAIDRDSIVAKGQYRTGWTYEMFRERNPLAGPRTQITGVLILVNCKTLLVRRLKVVHYLANGTTVSAIGPERVWTDSLRGSNTDLMLRAMCRGPDSEWAQRRAGTVFDLYALVWSR